MAPRLSRRGPFLAGDNQADSCARARARTEGEGARRGCGAARSQKKSERAVGRRGRRFGRGERAVILASLCEAQTGGARLHAACRVIGISARTIERWRGQPGGDDRRCGPRRRPRNALTAAEEAHLLAIMTSARYGHLSPKQLVSQLADTGKYIASESTMYRLQKRL